MKNIRVSPEEPNPTHHIAALIRSGQELGLILCDDDGKPYPQFNKFPIETTALKQSSGQSSYASFDYPYEPIVQDDLSGGRGGEDFERDTTKYSDAYRCKAGRANKAYAGPQEQFPTGLQGITQAVPGNVTWHQLTEDARTIYRRFEASANYTARKIWVMTRIKGTPADLRVSLYSDTAGALNAELAYIVIPYTRMDDILSEWLCETISQAVTGGTFYWLVIEANESDDSEDHWKVAVKDGVGSSYSSGAFDSTPTIANFDIYFRLTELNTTQTCVPYEYKEQQYFVVNNATGAPKLFMAGDRGTADANTGELSALKDGSKNWVVNEHAGKTVLITDGTGKLELTTYRTIVSNTPTKLVVSPDWTIEHDTTTEYVIHGDKLKEITGHGLTAPVTDVHVSVNGVVYFCMGDAVTVRRMREYTSGGTWTLEYADETSTTKAVFMVYKDQAQKIVIGNNSDVNGDVSVNVMSNASVPAWGTALTWTGPVKVGSKYRRITGMIVYPDESNNEAVWVMKTDIPYIVPGTGNPHQLNLDEMKTVRGPTNGVRPIRSGAYLYFPMQQGLERYYNSQIDDIGPNLGNGLPENRRGPIVWMQNYTGKFFLAVDAGSSGYSSVLDSDGYHERYRAPLGQRIKMLAFQSTAGPLLDRLWIFTGNDLIYLPFPSETVNELDDSTYLFTHEFAVTLSRMHAGLFDVQKIVKLIKLQTEDLDGETCFFELDYRVDADEGWTTFSDPFNISPTQTIDFTDQFGLVGKRLQFRIRGYTTDAHKTPVLIAIIVNAVLRTDVKYRYQIQFRIMDHEPLLAAREEDPMSAMEKLRLIEELADASTDSMIHIRSVSRLFDDKMIFLNPPETRQILYRTDASNEFKRDVFVCRVTLQEA